MCHNHLSFPYTSHDHVNLLTCLSLLKQSYTGIDSWRFLFVVYGFELLVRVCPVSLLLVLVVVCLIACVSSLVLVVTLYLSFCIYHLHKLHMMCG